MSASLVNDPSALSAAIIAVIPLDGGGRWLIDRHGHVFAEGSAADTWGGCAADVAAPVVNAPVVAPPAAATTCTVEPGDSLWEIVQEAYGVSEVGAIVSMVNLVLDSNRDQLSDPNVLDVGMVLQLPPRQA